jgi:Sulfotransferase family
MTMGKQFRPKELILLYTTMIMIFPYLNVRDLLIANSELVSTPSHRHVLQEEASLAAVHSPTSRGSRYYYDEPQQLDPNIFQGVAARTFEPWANEVRCFPKEDNSTPQKERGMMFLKTMKTGSTTAMGVQMKIAQNEAQRAKSTTADNPCESVHKHQFAFRGFANRDRKKSFLWSIVRDPTSRLVSYLFFHYVSRLKNEPYDQGFIDFIRGSESSAKYDHYMKWMSLTEYKPGETDPVRHANRILADYDFIAVTEVRR